MSESWKQNIFEKLREKNRRECENFVELFTYNQRLFQQSEVLRTENLKLTLQNEKLQEENHCLLQSCNACDRGSDASETAGALGSSKYIQQLEQKLYKLQEELTDLHRNKGENAQKLVELNQVVQDHENVLSAKENKLSEYESEILLLKEELLEKKNEIVDLEAVSQLIRDEYQALNLAFTSLEKKHVKLSEENRELIDRWMSLKARDAEKLNEENDTVLKIKQMKLEEQLKEASTEQKAIIMDDKYMCNPPMPLCFSSSVPTKAYLTFDAHDAEVNTIIHSPQGKFVATGSADRKLKLWDLSHGTAELVGTLLGSNAGVSAISFSSEEGLIIGASNDFASRIWSLPDNRLRHTLTGHSGKVMAAKFLENCSKAVTGSHDRTIKIWDLRSRSCTRTIFAGSSCNDLVCGTSVSSIISAHFDKKVRLWDARTEKPALEILLSGKVTSVCLAHDGLCLLCCVRDDTLRAIDLRKCEILNTYCADGFHVGVDYCRAVFSPDSTYVVAGGNDGGVYFWQAATTKLESVLREHQSCVVACSWHPQGNYLVSCERTKQVIAWSDF